MQIFAALFTIFAIILSANAAVIVKRAVPEVNSCINDISSISTQLDVLGPSVKAGGVVDVSSNYSNLVTSLRAAQSTCCAINTVISEADADETLASLSILTPKVLQTLSDISSKQQDYHFIARLIVKTHVQNFEERTQELNTCLSTFTPPSKTSVLEEYFNQIRAAFSSTKAAYGV